MPALPREPRTSDAPLGGAIVNGVTAKEKLLKQAPGWTEEQAERALRAAAVDAAEFAVWLASRPPLDDEPWTDADEAAIAEVHADRAAGAPTFSHEEIKREFGIGQ